MGRSGRHSRAPAGAHRAASGTGKPIYRDWVWWPNDPERRSRAKEEFENEVPSQVRGEMLSKIKRFMAGESRFKDVDDLGGGIKEIRHRQGNNHYRILFVIDGDVCVALTCFYKNQNKTPKPDLERARKRRDAYLLSR